MGYSVEGLKHRLVIDICLSSKRTGNVCPHLVHSRHSEPRFVDWYLLLGVEENADADVIRRRFHKLALRVHPDKNDHPDADIAFKLLAEAYNCLSDAAKRKAFDVAKWKNSCPRCQNLHRRHPPKPDNAPDIGALKNIRDRFREEARVIESCMRVYTEKLTTKGYRQRIWSKTVEKTTEDHLSFQKKEIPVFDPSRHEFSGYPHVRSRVDQGIGERWRCRKAADSLPVFRVEEGSGTRSVVYEIQSIEFIQDHGSGDSIKQRRTLRDAASYIGEHSKWANDALDTGNNGAPSKPSSRASDASNERLDKVRIRGFRQ